MFYTALNLRPYLTPQAPDTSYWFLSIGYCNVILPGFAPPQEDKEKTENAIWHRARGAKKQMMAAVQHPLLVPRTREMARERSRRARRRTTFRRNT